ncbi:pyruvate dehydrogenase [Salinibacterium sp. G-O1]|uniref:transketolase-like TK C-terminal-containing protein n=1 Tax=Salinibacterium sp. G-O1 TaxID=3046208 RepID=UPI0024BAD647|nr:pyruvate dehydrogenase [Salinibacterium sp. G-O1]MDJ0334322.1 pyruvate dehydrogenase [Salinibacterium sp. G-O1]
MENTITSYTALDAVDDTGIQLDTLQEVERKILWLSTAMIHHANRVRENVSGMKVGGHQASSASIATIMTSLWFGELRPEDRVSVKPHASPVLHAINYLLGSLDARYLTTLRQFGGLQSYPSRSKDPDPVDYSTGSVGIGATATIWGALSRRYTSSVTGVSSRGRQYALVGDAELDEGAIWEAVLDPNVADLGELVWIVDLNRQSLDRVVPNIAAGKIEQLFLAAGWQVIVVRFGALLESILAQHGGEALRKRIVEMPNAEYQRILRCTPAEARERLSSGNLDIQNLLAGLDDDTLVRALRNLGGHDLSALRAAYAQIDDTKPTAIIAYTIKGHGLPTEGHPQNHSSLLTVDQFTQLAGKLGEDEHNPWATFAPGSAAAALCSATGARLTRVGEAAAAVPAVPTDFGRTPSGAATTQAALGRTLLDLTRSTPELARRVVTVSPDVSSSTNLAGWVNKVGVWSSEARQNWFDGDGETIMHWREKPDGQHIELGIAESNLVGLLGELGSTWSRWGQPLIPIGVLYDPFLERALEQWSYGIYAGGQSIIVGTPSGVTLAAEGGAHQSIKTPSIGMEQPGCVSYEPAFALDVEWILLAAIANVGRPDGTSAYLRLSTKSVDQKLAAIPVEGAARERRRRQTVAGGYFLRKSNNARATLVAAGAVIPETLDAAAQLEASGVAVDVVCITSPGLLFEAMQARNGQGTAPSWILDQVFPVERARPMVTVLDGHPHTLSFLAGIHRVASRHLGVTGFGQSGDMADVYKYHGLDADSITRAVLDVLAVETAG